MKFDLVANRKFLYLISGGLFVLSLVLLAIPPALRPGIEFTSGTTLQVQFQQRVVLSDLRDEMAKIGHPEARVQSISGTDYLIRTSELQVPPGSFTEPAAEAPTSGSTASPPSSSPTSAGNASRPSNST